MSNQNTNVAFSLQKKSTCNLSLEEAIEGNQDTSLLPPLLFIVKRVRYEQNNNARIHNITLQCII